MSMNDLSDGETSSDYGPVEEVDSSERAVMIPEPKREDVVFAPFQTYRCYGVDIEFPQNRTPFPSQRSVMTFVWAWSVDLFV